MPAYACMTKDLIMKLLCLNREKFMTSYDSACQGRSQDLGGGPRNIFIRFGNLHVASAMRFARGVWGHAPTISFFLIVQFGAFWCIF